MTRLRLLICALLLGPMLGVAQIDSLKAVLESEVHDTSQIQALNELAYQLRKDDPTGALDYALKAIKRSEEIGYQEGLARGFLYAGMDEKYQAHFEQALMFYKEAHALFAELGDDVGMALSLNGQGIVFKNLGDYDKAAELYFESAGIYERLGEEQKLGVAYNNLGNLYKNSEDYERALRFHRRGLSIRLKLGDELGIAASYHNMANVFHRVNKKDTALIYYLKALGIRRAQHAKSDLATTLQSLGGFYVDNGEVKLGREYLLEARDLNEEIGDAYSQALVYDNLGKSYAQEGNMQIAYSYYDRGLQFAEEVGSLPVLRSAYESMAYIQNQLGNYKEAYDYLEKSAELKDSLFNLDKQSQLTMFQIRFGVAEQTKELEAQRELARVEHEKVEMETDKRLALEAKRKSEKEAGRKQEAFMWGLGIAFALLAVVLVLIWRNSLQRKQANQKLERQQQEILIKNNSLENANEKIVRQSDEIAQKNKDITDSINYAEKIQRSALPSEGKLEALFPDSFVLYKPKDIISGDFYWFTRVADYGIVAVADCTGHGVPGALMCMTGLNLLHQIVTDKNISAPSEALRLLDEGVYAALSSEENSEARDGMDISLCAINLKTLDLQFAGAARPLVVVSDGDLSIYKGSKSSIGGHFMEEKQFEDTEIRLKPGDQVYMFSDGYADQFGGEKGKKFKNKTLREMLLRHRSEQMGEKKRIFSRIFEDWKGELEQVDDVCMLGFTVGQ